MRVLVTGADGFVGEHTIRALLAEGHHVVGGISGDSPRLATLSRAEAEHVEWRTFDLRDSASVEALVSQALPDGVLHLAATSSVQQSWGDPAGTMDVNAIGTLRLLQAIRRLPTPQRRRPVILVGSAEAYGADGTEAAPLSEDRPLHPVNPYGASKAAQEAIGWALGRSDTIRLVQTRSFPHTGPGQQPTFVLADWAGQLLRIRNGAQVREVRVGNVDVRRDYSDVRDVASAYTRLLNTDGAEGVFNVCSGKGYSLQELLDLLAGIIDVQVTVTVDAERYRPADIESLVGDPSRLRETTGWRPLREMIDTLRDLVDDLRKQALAP